MRYVTARRDDAGHVLAIDDPLAPRIAEAVGDAADPVTIVERLLGITEIFGDLADDVALRGLLAEALTGLTEAGALAALRNTIGA
jgi:mannitol-1-phosphate/altronate dehydrogenase